MTTVGQTFDVLGPLPGGRVVIEASAGTGKTYTLAALATRYLAEGKVAPSELLIVTFTRAATAELRSRIREQLVTSAAALADGGDDPGDDALSRHLASTDRDARRVRLEQALADFDSVSISTMHSFAAQVRSTLGISSAIDPDARLTTDVAKVVKHACADALATASVGGIPADELPKLADLVKATEVALSMPDIELQPRPGTPGAAPGHLQLRALVQASVDNVTSRQSGSGTLGFDDVLTQLRDALVSPAAAPVAAALRSRYRVVLIDEFQDTDRVQWEIFSTLFAGASPDGTLVLVGDPKQAIYRFRGADIGVYLGAVDPASGATRFSLGTNWRSDGAAVRAMGHLFAGATFGDPSIGYVDVDAADVNRSRRLATADGRPYPGLLVQVPVGSELPRKGKVPDTVRAARIVERDLVAHVRDLLDHGWIPTDKKDDTPRRLLPSDIAVLVTSGTQARSAQSALRRQGVPAVVSGGGSVLSSLAADHLRILLHAMEKPSDLRRVRAYALSWFSGLAPHEVASAGDEDLRRLQDQLADWANRLADHPVAEVLAHVGSTTGVVERLLRRFDGDRHVTDLDHLTEFLHAGATRGMSSVAGLRSLLDAPPESEADLEVDGDVVARRVESEDRAVQIMTIWKAKGLEFPVVCLPMLWRKPKDAESIVYTDPGTGQRCLDLARGKDWPTRADAEHRKELARAEEAGERLRLLYVAFTRARHHTAVWWVNSTGSATRALSRLLFAREARTGRLDPDEFASGRCVIPDEDQARPALHGLESGSDGTILVGGFGTAPAPGEPWSPPGDREPPPVLSTATFLADLPRDVHRWSFSAITRRRDEAGGDPYDDSRGDRGASDEETPDGGAGADGDVGDPTSPPGAPSDDVLPAYAEQPLALLRAGTSFGTFVHGVLERLDFAAGDLTAAIAEAVGQERDRSGLDVDGLGPGGVDGFRVLVDGLRAAVESPLGPLFEDRSLSRLARTDRLDELAFDLRLGHHDHRPAVRDIGHLVLGYLPEHHPLRPWAADLAAGSIDLELAGFLTGSIDLVARVRHRDGVERFVVADYKTNQLMRRGGPPRADDYGPRPMAEAMVEHHYPLQALLYAAALHRYLRWRSPGGEGTTRVAGAAYLFVRGMTGADVRRTDGHPHGVVTWELPPGLVIGLSDLLAGRTAARVAS